MVAYGVDEMKLAGLTPAPCRYVKAPRVAESPMALECKYWKTLEIPIEPGQENHSAAVVFGQVVGVHIDDSILKDGRVDVMAFKPVARLGYSEYTTLENVWKMRRPDDPKYQ
jgi:flavin reductase (DIM6/NTAB) family NADH-FMN oxidoreductase RutF